MLTLNGLPHMNVDPQWFAHMNVDPQWFAHVNVDPQWFAPVNVDPQWFAHSCMSPSELAPGCNDVSRGMEASLQMSLDPDREFQRIHSLLVTHMDRLDKLKDACECQAVYTGDVCFLPSFVIEDVQSCFHTLTAVRDVVFCLEQEHRSYLRSVARETKYGSKQAPIGDDNYLLLAARVGRLDTSFLKKTFNPPD
uniref:(California timema) hypothetical protein n=1 Tax=Timema californicum TaxID=61474 RepID=A0A7R9JI15_TIMCA|nr:unnamed protein product [Timema californicum]